MTIDQEQPQKTATHRTERRPRAVTLPPPLQAEDPPQEPGLMSRPVRAARQALLSPLAFALAFGAYAQVTPARAGSLTQSQSGPSGLAQPLSEAAETELSWLEDWLQRNGR